MTDRIDELLAEVNKLTAQRNAARERARDAVDRNDAFVNELCMLIPDDRDDDIGAEAIIIGWVKELLADRNRARDAAVALEQQLAEIKRLAYIGGQSDGIVRRWIIGIFENDRRALEGGEG